MTLTTTQAARRDAILAYRAAVARRDEVARLRAEDRILGTLPRESAHAASVALLVAGRR
jgi:septum formation inhibitor-activating ATPase MinD